MRRFAAAFVIAVALLGAAAVVSTAAAGVAPGASAPSAAGAPRAGAGAAGEAPSPPRDNSGLAAVVVIGLLAFIGTTAVLGSMTRER